MCSLFKQHRNNFKLWPRRIARVSPGSGKLEILHQATPGRGDDRQDLREDLVVLPSSVLSTLWESIATARSRREREQYRALEREHIKASEWHPRRESHVSLGGGRSGLPSRSTSPRDYIVYRRRTHVAEGLDSASTVSATGRFMPARPVLPWLCRPIRQADVWPPGSVG